MKTIFRGAAMAAALIVTSFSTPSLAADITVSDVWARASAGMARNGGAFMMIGNKGHSADKLVAASAPVSKTVELHTHIKEGDVMRMREVEGGIDVPAMGSVMLKPGGLHVMFMGLGAPLKEGQTFPLTLTFEKAGKVETTVTVKKAGAMGAMNHGAMDHGKMKH